MTSEPVAPLREASMVRYEDGARSPSYRVDGVDSTLVAGWVGFTLHRIPANAASLKDWLSATEARVIGEALVAAADALDEAVRAERGEKHIDYWKHEYDLAVEGWQQRGNQHEQALERIEQLEGALRRIDALDLVEMRRQGIDGDIGEAAQDIAIAALASRAP